jgi:hypothetical protein
MPYDMGSQPKMQVQDIKTPIPQPSAIVCIDEERQSIGKVDSEYSQFHCFRKALAYCWGTARLKGTRNWYNPDRNYFALLLDTSSRVSNFSPAQKGPKPKEENSLFASTCNGVEFDIASVVELEQISMESRAYIGGNRGFP